jgi:hypothetical protein
VKYPGEGAIEYARTLITGLSREQAAIVIENLLNDAPSDDPRVKFCSNCGYPFRDKTKPNMAKVCGPACKSAVKTIQKRIQRTGLSTVKVKMPIYYQWWQEYPFFSPHEAMQNRVWSYERPHGNVEAIIAAKDRYERMGGRRKGKGEYDDED